MADELVDNTISMGNYTYVFEGSNVADSKISVGDKTDGRWPALWEKGDVVGVFKADGTFVGSAAISDDYAGKNTARFTISSNVALSSGEPVHFVYPYSSDVKFSDGSFTASVPTEQIQKAKNSSAGVGDYSVAYSTAVYNGDRTSFVLSYANAYLKVNLLPGEFVGYSLHAVTLWSKGQKLSGKVSLAVEDCSLEVSEINDYVRTDLAQPVVMENGSTYSFWLSALPGDFTDKEVYAIVHMTKDEKTATLPVLLKTGELPDNSVTEITLKALAKSQSPEWYEPIETRYVAAYGKGWCYGPENTVLFSLNNQKIVDLKARGNFMKVTKPAYVRLVYANDQNVNYKSGIVFFDGAKDAHNGTSYIEHEVGDDYSVGVTIKKISNSAARGQIAGMLVMDAQKKGIWGINLWACTNAVSTVSYANGDIMTWNLGTGRIASEYDDWKVGGCYFQWGRPWAFAWSKDVLTEDLMLPADETGTLEKSAANPYSFMYQTGDPFDWYYGDGSRDDRSGDLDDLWGNPNPSSSVSQYSGAKSIYDPCPEGYMVVSPAVLAELENAEVVNGSNTSYLSYKGASWSLAGGYWGSKSTSSLDKISNAKYEAAYWSNSNSGAKGWLFSYCPSTGQKTYGRNRTGAFSVRCMVEVRDLPTVGGSGSPAPGPGGSTGGEIEDDDDQIPEDFEEEADDATTDPTGIFDYSKLAKADHPRLLCDAQGFKDLKAKVTTGRAQNKTLYKLHNEVLARAEKIVQTQRKVADSHSGASDHYVVVDNLLCCAYAYKLTGDPSYLAKVKTDIAKVSSWTKWDPYGLAIGEISMAMGLAYDWLYYDLDLETRKTAHKAMIDKGIKPMYSNNNNITIVGNWNQINLGGVSVASMAVYEKDKTLAVQQMEKAARGNLAGVTGIYSPNGNYSEGLGYWEYGGSFEVCYLSALEGVFGHTGGIKEVSGFMDSGEYAMYMHGTMNTAFSYNDGGPSTDPFLLTSWWFAAQKNNPDLIYCEKRRLDDPNDNSYKNTSITGSEMPYRLLAPMVVMLRNLDIDSRPVNAPTRQVWSGKGERPVVMVRRGWNFDSSDVFLGAVGGLADTWETSTTAHGHMDAGSFVFEAEGVRWSDDIMRPGYTNWSAALKAENPRIYTAQEGLLWDTFHVSNLCHSTIVAYANDGTVKGKLHSSDYYVDGYASLVKTIDEGGRQGGTFDMSAPMKGQVKSARRTIELVDGTDLVVTDEITALDALDCRLEWRMLSISSSEKVSDGVTLTNGNKSRKLTVTSSSATVTPVYMTWPTSKPTGDGWGVLNFHQEITDRTIAGWTVTVPKGQTVKFVTTLKKVSGGSSGTGTPGAGAGVLDDNPWTI